MAILWFIPTYRRFQLIFLSLRSEYAPSTPKVIATIVHITILIGVIIPISRIIIDNTIEIIPETLSFLLIKETRPPTINSPNNVLVICVNKTYS